MVFLISFYYRKHTMDGQLYCESHIPHDPVPSQPSLQLEKDKVLLILKFYIRLQ